MAQNHNSPLVWILIGVAGSGKTSIGRLLAEYWDCDYLEGDRRHSALNRAKMAAHKPLNDSDRQQWLADLSADIQWAIQHHREVVLTCSALKAAYRQHLTQFDRVQLVWLQVSAAELQRRLMQRPNHYMTIEMLSSQLATFEAIGSDENVLCVDGDGSPMEVVNQILSQATQRYPILQQPWWQR